MSEPFEQPKTRSGKRRGADSVSPAMAAIEEGLTPESLTGDTVLTETFVAPAAVDALALAATLSHTPAELSHADTAPVDAAPIDTNPTIETKEPPMIETFQQTAATMTDAGNAATAKMGDAMAQGKQGYEAMTAKAKDMMEHSMKSMTEMTEFAKGNVEAMVASAKAATAGAETLASAMVEHGKKQLEGTTAAVKSMTTAKSPNELMQLQNDFLKAQYDHSVAMWSAMTETMMKVAGEVSQPLSNRMALAGEQMKSVVAR